MALLEWVGNQAQRSHLLSQESFHNSQYTNVGTPDFIPVWTYQSTGFNRLSANVAPPITLGLNFETLRTFLHPVRSDFFRNSPLPCTRSTGSNHLRRGWSCRNGQADSKKFV